MGLFAPATKAVNEALAPIYKRFVAEMPNEMQGFYGTPAQKAVSMAVAGGKTLKDTLVRELSPFHLKQQKLFRDNFVPRRAQLVLKKELDFLDSPAVVGAFNDEMSLRTAKSARTRISKKKNKTAEDIANLKKANATIERGLPRESQELMAKAKERAKVVQGELGWNYLTAQQYHQKMSDAMALKFAPENYHGAGKFTEDEFIKGANSINLNPDYIPYDNIVTPQKLGMIYHHIRESQGLSHLPPEQIEMFVKKAHASRASGWVDSAINTNDKKQKAVFNMIKKKGSEFDTVEELSKAAEEAGVPNRVAYTDYAGKELDEPVIMFQNAIKSSAYELGDSNVLTLVDKRGNMISSLADKNDMVGISMPGGSEGVTVVPPYIRNPLYKQPKAKQKQYKLDGPKRNTAGGAMTQKQREAADLIRQLEGDPLAFEDYAKYAAKVGGLTAAGGMMSTND